MLPSLEENTNYKLYFPPPFTLPQTLSLLFPQATLLSAPSSLHPMSHLNITSWGSPSLTTHSPDQIRSPIIQSQQPKPCLPDLFLGNFIVHAIPMCILVPPPDCGFHVVKSPQAGSLSLGPHASTGWAGSRHPMVLNEEKEEKQSCRPVTKGAFCTPEKHPLLIFITPNLPALTFNDFCKGD